MWSEEVVVVVLVYTERSLRNFTFAYSFSGYYVIMTLQNLKNSPHFSQSKPIQYVCNLMKIIPHVDIYTFYLIPRPCGANKV